jgi:hypothetical protein
MRVVTQGGWPVVTVEGTAFNYDKIFNYYITTIGVSPYFTFGGYLFKFVYTGYDAKTGKYHSGGKNEILICVDGLFVENTGSGTHYVSKKGGLGGSGTAIGGVMGLPTGVGVTIQPLSPGETPVISVSTTPPPPSSPPILVNKTFKAGPPGTYSPTSPSSPTSFPVERSTAAAQAITAAMIAAAQPQPTQYYAPPVAVPAATPTGFEIAVGLLALGVLGGVLYLVLD